MKVSIVIACCNEKAIIEKIVEPVHDATNIKLTDMEKQATKPLGPRLFDRFRLKKAGLVLSPKLSPIFPRGSRIYEVGISYSERTYSEGEKIN